MEAGQITDEHVARMLAIPDTLDAMDARQGLLEHAVLGVPIDAAGSIREGGLIQRIASLEAFTKGLFFTVLAANVMGGVIATALFLLIK